MRVTQMYSKVTRLCNIFFFIFTTERYSLLMILFSIIIVSHVLRNDEEILLFWIWPASFTVNLHNSR